MRNRIESLFRDVLGPLFAVDGGSIELVDVRENVVVVRLGGAYRGCPSASYTLESVVIPAIRRTVHSDVTVETVP